MAAGGKGFAVVVLAAGQGTRMKSKLPKALHRAAGRTLLDHVLRAVSPLQPEHRVVVVGEGAEAVRESVTEHEVVFVTQDFSTGYGTGHALMAAEAALEGFGGAVMVLNGDGPLLKTETLERLLQTLDASGGAALITCQVNDPTGLGRIVRDASGHIGAIVEQKDLSADQNHIDEVNPGIYLFDNSVFAKTRLLSNDNAAGEYYITDLPRIYLEEGSPVRGLSVEDETEVLGVNDRRHLAHIDAILRDRVRERWLTAGVTMQSPQTTFIDDTVFLGPDVTLEPGVVLKGGTHVGEGATIGAYAYLEDCTLQEGAQVPPHTVRKGETLT